MSGHVGHHIRLSASRLGPRTQSRSGLQNGSHLFASRIRLDTPGQRRHFGVADAAGALLKGSELLVTSVHDLTGAPWFISLPMVAVVVSASIRTPLTLYAHNLRRRRTKLMPLIQAQYAQIGLGLRRKAVSNLRERVLKAVKKRSKATFKVFAIDGTKSIWGSFLSLPIFLSNLEVIRRMCGGPRGLIGTLLYGWQKDTPTATTTTTVPGTAEAVEAAASGSTSITSDAISVADLPSPTDLAELATTAPNVLGSISMEPTFATGGCLWFPNLLVPDPYHILPFAVSALLFASMIPETTAQRRDLFGLKPLAAKGNMTVGGGQSRMWRALQRSLLVMALAIGPVTMDMPAALHLYWMSSVGCSLVVTRGIRKLMPIPKSSVKPCTGLEVPLLRPKP
ncbi:hypothetical protein VPNG_05095 [Cytospora leucostoma]|uniref:Uncharacterized protein n=1 Tax=Cytospora leucostoma TaxID=1230097 RepID=A0A423X4W5_9PEZI|nr:hypothetical protein VPNG_05095 [Cytospora leucostoma]